MLVVYAILFVLGFNCVSSNNLKLHSRILEVDFQLTHKFSRKIENFLCLHVGSARCVYIHATKQSL